MNTDLDVLVFATRLVDELGETAIRMSRVRLVELTAANHTRAAAFWRDVMRTSERLLSERSGRRLPAGLSASTIAAAQPTGTLHKVAHVPRPIP
ncbi:hypothetical protein JHL17_19555 [Azospirillum sp. YIM B02556]|uniref:Uncharacterized protein n=1 Tax=Azospirillum endophyticum TaxID=2800326 RepID=A0ABS1F876_9PROT|nr:hypothetical protein [Azospirillum endophyticum]MBK1839611.1 hypothetical protein [Azospirillum endophyticum]